MQSSLDNFVRKSPGSGVKRRRADTLGASGVSPPALATGVASPTTPTSAATAVTAAAEPPPPVDAAMLARIEANRIAAMAKLAAKRARLAAVPSGSAATNGSGNGSGDGSGTGGGGGGTGKDDGGGSAAQPRTTAAGVVGGTLSVPTPLPGSPLHPSWARALASTLASPGWARTRSFLRQTSGRVFPPPGDIFAALNATPLPDVRVVILGQDPYHNDRQAHGLAFSVRPGTPVPPSLANIYREVAACVPGWTPPTGPAAGSLTGWAAQGVLLLNAVLTVEAHRAGSHGNVAGWEAFTDDVLRAVCRSHASKGVVFLLWGGYAKKKAAVITADGRGGKAKRGAPGGAGAAGGGVGRHTILAAAHPSPLAANRGGWFGCGHFRRANEVLAARGLPTIDWARTHAGEVPEGGW
ncbi:hypothetical protein MMPV_007144 [Pyropia vietnamensis]